MIIPPKYTHTPKISQLLSSIESSKEVINSVQIPKEIEQNIRRNSILKSSLYSARIEGNSLTLDQIIQGSSKDQKKVEVFNILKVINQLYERPAKDLVINDLLKFHQTIMNGLIEKSDLAKFRVEPSAIYNSAGIAVYLPPPPRQIIALLNRLLNYANSSKEPFVPIKALLTHYSFEKIHPFLDGNGRVGRILLQAILIKGGFGMKGLLSLEEQLDNKRSLFYRALEEPEKDVTDYLEFMLECIADASILAKEQVLQKRQSQVEDYLLPRRAEIFNIIKDHKLINFDQIRRRFLSVNERTLRYDLKKLQDEGLIKKLGSTKGVYYQHINREY
jgi:Fic family protein